jgi:thiamine-monophosphate kinase
MNEFDFIRSLREQTRSRRHSARVVTGIGDDASLIAETANRNLVVTTDLLVEDVDFHRDAAPPRLLGHKALAVSLSDIAAMGARPFWSFVSIALTAEVWKSDFKDEFFAGYLAMADQYGVTLAGGDVSETKTGIVIDSIVLGEVRSETAVLRSGARAGDRIYVTGSLGGAAGGLKLIEMGARLGEGGLASLPRPGGRADSPTANNSIHTRDRNSTVIDGAEMDERVTGPTVSESSDRIPPRSVPSKPCFFANCAPHQGSAGASSSAKSAWPRP